MKVYTSTVALLTLSLAADSSFAFTAPLSSRRSAAGAFAGRVEVVGVNGHGPRRSNSQRLQLQQTPGEQNKVDDEIERLTSMAQRLRAEAAALEADRAAELAMAAESAFRKFDTNQDGEISFQELKAGLEKVLKTELPERRVQQLMDDFDVSGDGALQIDEFVGMEKFRNRLESLAREEKQAALDAAKAAQKEEDMAKMAEAKLGLLNEKEPTNTEKVLSVLPYLFPLIDSVQFGTFLLLKNQENPLVLALAIFYGLFRSVPFGGFATFLALSFLSGNPSINRLVRFNMQQAIFLDIALFFPAIFGTLLSLIGGGNLIPMEIRELSSDAVFIVLLLSIVYASVSSLLGITPNKLPIISQAVEDRMPTVDMFDDNGRFVPRKRDDDKKD
jgi:hypothetical protein